MEAGPIPAFCLDSYPSRAGCIIWSWHFTADSSVMPSSHFHSGPCHTFWVDLISITIKTWISADSKPHQSHQTSASALNEAVGAEGVFNVGSDLQKLQFMMV